MSQADRAESFRKMHAKRPLVLPNAWDAASARLLELLGAEAIGTTSAGVSWACGRRDGQQIQRGEMAEALRRIVQAVSVPVTADVESCYGSGSMRDVNETVQAAIAAGAVGINIEDSPGHGGSRLLAPEAHAERIRMARKTALAVNASLVINARTDVYLFEVGEPETRFDATVERANLYLEAGADCIFVPGVLDANVIAALVRAIGGPLNVMAAPGAPRISELGRLGVARVSIGSALMQTALASIQRAARELLEAGTYQALGDSLPFEEANHLFRRVDVP